jgi:DNA helicase II / ATP-dependent DNA helicase PcrA
MQWPAVFHPALRRNTFPSKRSGGLNIFHVIDPILVPDSDRYRGTLDDERRLFYVAVTRAQKYLTLTFASNGKQTGRNPSEFDAATPFKERSSRISPRPIFNADMIRGCLGVPCRLDDNGQGHRDHHA